MAAVRNFEIRPCKGAILPELIRSPPNDDLLDFSVFYQNSHKHPTASNVYLIILYKISHHFSTQF